MQTFILPKGERNLTKIVGFLSSLSPAKSWKLEIGEHRRKRSDGQNAYLWGVVYPTILQSADSMTGWHAEDLHDYFLGEHFGWEVLNGFGKKRMRPIRRSSKLTTVEFMDYVAFIQRRMAEMGVFIPDPNEYLEIAA